MFSSSLEWKEWAKQFKTYRKRLLPNVMDLATQQRIRVTVIDTGIDGSHPYMERKGWKSNDGNAPQPLFHDFTIPESSPNEHEPIDEDGHGTFIAGILLQLVPDIELSVARIGRTRDTIKCDTDVATKIGKVREFPSIVS
jgi:subtilisin family serine protease